MKSRTAAVRRHNRAITAAADEIAQNPVKTRQETWQAAHLHTISTKVTDDEYAAIMEICDRYQTTRYSLARGLLVEYITAIQG